MTIDIEWIELVIMRGGPFVIVLSLLLWAESLWPRRSYILSRLKRWKTNFAIAIMNIFVLRLMGPLTAIAGAQLATQKGWGFFNLFDRNGWVLDGLILLLTIFVLDFAIYIQHVVMHKIPFLWRFHKVHHADRDIDMSTALRFHPVEIMFSMLYKFCLVILIGPMVWVVVIFETLLNSSAMFNHANIKLPNKIDHILRMWIVTPDMHRVHHSIIPSETNSNYGFFLCVWDRVFKTYRAQPKLGHLDMKIGLQAYQTDAPAQFLWSLKFPWQKD